MPDLTTGCGFDLLNCDANPNDIYTEMVRSPGVISSHVYQTIQNTSPIIKLFEKTKEPFPDGIGDTLTSYILDVGAPNERDVLEWQPVREAGPDYSPCCTTYREFTYGSKKITTCLTRDGWKSKPFCKPDVVMKWNWREQLRQVLMVAENFSSDIWKHWLVYAYQKNVYCTVLNAQRGNPERFGEYPPVRPTSMLTIDHLDEIMERIHSAGGIMGRPIKNYDVILIGKNEFNWLKKYEMKRGKEYNILYNDMTLPNYAEFNIPDLGKVCTYNGYAFIVIDKPRRFRDPLPNENWIDALVPSTKYQKTWKGQERVRNNDYYNQEIAKYSETLILNLTAITWYVPPTAMEAAIEVGGKELFPATNYSGEFSVHHPSRSCDPKQQNMMLLADFMGGMRGLAPKRGRAVLHNAAHIQACDVIDVNCECKKVEAVEKFFIKGCCKLLNGNLQLQFEGNIDVDCAEGKALFLVSEKERKYLIAQVVSSQAFAGDSQNGKGTIIEVRMADAAAAVCRREFKHCDPWDHIACLASDTQCDNPQTDGCLSCADNEPAEPANPTDFEAVFISETALGMQDAAGNELFAGTFADAAALQTALQTWLDGNGGGTASVVGGTAADQFVWTLNIEGSDNAALDSAKIVYADASADGENTIALRAV